MSFRRRERGFTLIEILIVVSIISILVSLVLGGIMSVRMSAYKSIARSMVETWSAGLDTYVQEMGFYPATDYEPDENAFPVLYEALLGDKPADGRGGNGVPYIDLKQDSIRVRDEDDGGYRKPHQEELYDSEVEKFVVDPWGEVYWYRANKGRERENYMKRPRKADIWSIGADRNNATLPGAEDEGEESDDIGNW